MVYSHVAVLTLFYMDNASLHDTLAGALAPSKSSAFSRFLGRVVDVCLYAAVMLVPLWFMTKTLDVLELNKQTLLVVLTMVALMAWLGKAILEKKLTLTRSWMHAVVVLFGLGYLVVSLFSQDRYLSLVGNLGQMQWAFTSVAAFVLFYLVMVNTVNTTTKLYDLLLAFLGSSVVVGLYGISQAAGAYPLAWLAPLTANAGFNTIGSFNSLAVYLTVPLIIAASLTVLGCKDEGCVLGRGSKSSLAAKGLVWAALAISTLVLVLVDYWVAWALVLIGSFLLVGITYLRTKSIGHPTKVIVPGVLCLLAVALLIWKTPINLNIPGEVAPSPSHSWEIAKNTLQDHALFGSGPGTWIFDYAKYRSSAANLTQFWQIRFDRGYDSLLSLLAMLGIVGTSLWLILVGSGIGKSVHHLMRERSDDTWQAYLTVFVGWVMTVLIAFLYNFNFSHHFLFWFLLALLAALVSNGTITLDGRKSPSANTALSILLVVISVCAFSVTWLAGQRLVADAKYSSSVVSFRNGHDIQESIDALNSAVALNRLNDSYYRNLSQAYLIRLSKELQGQPSQDKATLINSLVSAAIDTAKKATEVSPSNVDNWSNLATVYQAIASFTRGADEFAIKNYQEALSREPNNPAFYNEIGKLYVLRSDAYRTLLSSNDAKTRADAEGNVKSELDKAAGFLNQSIQVKPDFALAHYSLGIVYERQGRLKDAITKLEQVLGVNNKDVGTAFQLAILYYRDGQKDKSLNLFEQIVAFDPSYANARWYLASLYEERGRYDDAIAQVMEVKKTNPDNQLVNQRLEALRKLRDARSSKTPPASQPLPDPVKENIEGPKGLNEVQKP